jgi:glycosyltransferase involved in cell wall biosynthesis
MKKNILHIIESLEFGGAEKVVLQLANGMSKKANVSICVTKREGDLLSDVNDDVVVHALNSREGNDYSVISKIARIIKDNNIDVVHGHNWSVFIEAALASKYAGVDRFVHTIHGPYMSYDETILSKLKIYLRHVIERILSLFVYRFISVSDSIKNYMSNQIGINEKRIQTIHNGIKGLLKKDRTDVSENTINLISVGRVAKIKNHKLLLDALKIASENIDLHLTVVGDGPELENIKKQADDLSLNEKIDFLGFRTDIDDILKNMDICVVTSDYEGISIAILESMSVGLPVIATSVGGNPETVVDNETGILIGKGDKDALALALIKMASDESLRKSMGEAGNKRFYNAFHEDNVLEQYSAVYGIVE